jgi:two-component system, NtrC family, sensor kinase
MRRSIGFQFIITVGFVLVAVMLVFGWILLENQKSQLLGAKIEFAHQLSETIKKSTREDMMANRLDDVYRIIETIGEQDGISKVRVFEKSGTIIYSTKEDEIGSQVDMQTEACYACHASDSPIAHVDFPERTRVFDAADSRFLGIINPIYNEPGCATSKCHYHPEGKNVLGVLDITMGLDDLDSVLADMRNRTLGTILAAFFILSLLIYLFVRRKILLPVRRLTKAFKQVAAGDLSQVVETDQVDEIGMLTLSFNEMTAKLVEAQMQVSQSDKLASVGRLAAGVAHEINNPLTGVLTYSSFLLKRTGEVEPEQLKEDLGVIVRETERCRRIVKSLLDFARQSVFTPREVDVNDVVHRSIEVLANQISINSVKLREEIAGDLPKIYGDLNQLQQVVVNLLVNAIDAAAKGGEIEIATRAVSVAPIGNAQVIGAFCPEGCSLTSESTRIRNMPAITIAFRSDKGKGTLHLDPVYGSINNVYSLEVKPGAILEPSCPKCGISLADDGGACTECGAPLFTVRVPGSGGIRMCSRRGCHYESWDRIDEKGDLDFVEIAVTDDGVGIEPKSVERIFEPFYSTKGGKGTGLGLAVSWGIISSHGGTIKVESAPGKGSVFTVRLPVGNNGGGS